MRIKQVGIQVAVVTYYGNWRERVADWKSRGFYVILRDGFASVHSYK